MLRISSFLVATMALVVIGFFVRFPARSQAQGQFDRCTLTLFDASLVKAGSKTITLTNLVSLPNGVQRVTIPDLSVSGIDFARRINAYTFRCQGRNGRPISLAYTTNELFCTNVNFSGQCYAHTATSILAQSVEKNGKDTYLFSKADFSVLDKNAYFSFSATFSPR